MVSVWPIFSPNQIAVFWMSISWRQRIYWYMDILRCMDMFLITKILDLAYVQNYMRCLSQNKSDTKLFRVYLFTVFTIKRPRALASFAPLGLLIVKTVTNILSNYHQYLSAFGYSSFILLINRSKLHLFRALAELLFPPSP